jgi:hypothetical protein
MNRIIGIVIFWVLVGSMLVFTAAHTINFIGQTLPGDNQATGFFALAAFDVGLVGWAWVFQHVARGTVQRAIAGIMVGLSFLGLAAAFFADTWLQAGKNKIAGNANQDFVGLAIWITAGIVLLHVLAGTIFHLNDPKLKKQRDEEDLESAIEEEARKMARQNVKVLAAKLAPKLANHTLGQMSTRYLSGVQGDQEIFTLPPAPAPKSEAKNDIAKPNLFTFRPMAVAITRKNRRPGRKMGKALFTQFRSG